MSKFKVGNRVRICNKGQTCSMYGDFIKSNAIDYLKYYRRGYSPNNCDEGVIVGIGINSTSKDMHYAVFANGKAFCIGERGLEPAQLACSTIHIFTDGTTTTAVLKDGKSEVKRATAKCSPTDKFDFDTGAKLAFDRLMSKEDKPTVREVKRPAKVGEWVKITSNDDRRMKIGEIYKALENRYDGVMINHPQGTCDGMACLYHQDYVVLEGYQPPESLDVTINGKKYVEDKG